MIWKIIKGVARAAFSRPWEYMGAGAPNDWEFRVSPGEDVIAFWNPDKGLWVLFSQVVTMAEVKSMAEMDKNTWDWRQFLSVEDPD